MLTKHDLLLLEELLDRKLDQKLDKRFAEFEERLDEKLEKKFDENNRIMKAYIKQSITKALNDFWDQVIEPCLTRYFNENEEAHKRFDKRLTKLEQLNHTN